MFEVGRVCMKTAGREAGKYCVIVKKMDENFVMVTGPKSLTRVKRRRCNINHLEPIEDKLSIKAEASDADVLKAYQQASLLAKLGLEKPKKVKKAEPERPPKPPKPEKKEEKPKEKKVERKEKKVKKPEKKKVKKPEKKAKEKKARAGKKSKKK